MGLKSTLLFYIFGLIRKNIISFAHHYRFHVLPSGLNDPTATVTLCIILILNVAFYSPYYKVVNESCNIVYIIFKSNG